MARFLFTCWPLTGHVFGQVAIAGALRDRGHDVAFYTGESARGVLEQEDLTVLGFSRLDERRARDAVAAIEGGFRPGRRGGRRLLAAFRDWLVETIPDQLADLEPLIEEWQPDVIVCDLSMWAPQVVLWEKLEVPVALSSTFMGPLIPGPDAPAWGLGMQAPRTSAQRATARALTRVTELLGQPLRRRVDALRAEHGLPPMGCSVNRFAARLPLYLVGNVRELDYDRRDLPPSVHYVGASHWHPADDGSTEAFLRTVPDRRPWVHVTESTVHSGDPFILRAAARGLADAPVEAILTTGGHRDPASLGLGSVPPNIHVTRWLSHPELLPRCSVVVTAGGQATVLSALRAGVPLVLVPTTWDKPDNAQRVVSAGAGVRVAPKRCKPEALLSAVLEVLREPSYAAAAKRLGDRLGERPGAVLAAELLEELAPSYAVVEETR